MKVCGRTSRRRRSAARRRTRNLSNRRDRLPAQNGLVPADGRLSLWPAELISWQVAQSHARANRARCALALIFPPEPSPARAASGGPTSRTALLFFPFLLIEPLRPPPTGLSLTIITPGPQERPRSSGPRDKQENTDDEDHH